MSCHDLGIYSFSVKMAISQKLVNAIQAFAAPGLHNQSAMKRKIRTGLLHCVSILLGGVGSFEVSLGRLFKYIKWSFMITVKLGYNKLNGTNKNCSL
jgi:hypothetical protein